MLFASVPLLLILICLSNAEECQWKVTNLATKVEAPVVVAVTVSQIVDINSQSLGKFIVFSTFKTTPDFRNFMRLNGDVITLPIQSKLSTSKSSASKSCLNRRDLERKPKHKHVLFLNSYGNVSLFRPIKFNKVKSAEIWELAQGEYRGGSTSLT